MTRRAVHTILCVDVGNSSIKLSSARGGRVQLLGACPLTAGAKERRRRLARIVSPVKNPGGIIVSSVVPSITQPLARDLQAMTGVRPRLVTASMRFPFDLRVRNPRRIGVDRLCSAAGAVGTRRQNAIVIDMGSAITVDLVDRGVYRAGLIFAGPALSLAALGEFADQLPTLDFAEEKDAFGGLFQGTEKSMTLGVALGALGGVKEAVRLLERRSGGRPAKFVTGGGAAPFRRRLPRGWHYDPLLVGKGLYLLWTLNSTAASS